MACQTHFWIFETDDICFLWSPKFEPADPRTAREPFAQISPFGCNPAKVRNWQKATRKFMSQIMSSQVSTCQSNMCQTNICKLNWPNLRWNPYTPNEIKRYMSAVIWWWYQTNTCTACSCLYDVTITSFIVTFHRSRSSEVRSSWNDFKKKHKHVCVCLLHCPTQSCNERLGVTDALDDVRLDLAKLINRAALGKDRLRLSKFLPANDVWCLLQQERIGGH